MDENARAEFRKRWRRALGFEVDGPFLLAPMMGVTTPAFQALCRSRGAATTCAPMIFLDRLVAGGVDAAGFVGADLVPAPVGVQLAGDDPALVGPALDALSSLRFDFLDLNAACPAKRELGRGVGGALLRRPKRLAEVLEALVKHSPVPVTLKIRTGFDSPAEPEFRRVLAVLENAPVAAVFVHGRSVVQNYRVASDPAAVGVVVRRLSTPERVVVGNGDVVDARSAAELVERSGCDGVLVGRAAIGNPFAFSELDAPRSLGNRKPPSPREVSEEFLRFLRLTLDEGHPKRCGLAALRAQLAHFTRGFRGARNLRRAISRLGSVEAIEEFASQLPDLTEQGPSAGAAARLGAGKEDEKRGKGRE
ncbi:MAG: tRNA dihydrouridine synthase DusB [Promethearchaeota archaeon]